MAGLEVEEHRGVATASENAPGGAVRRKSVLLEVFCASIACDLVRTMNNDMGSALSVRHADAIRQGSKNVRCRAAAGAHTFAAHNAGARERQANSPAATGD